MTDREALELLVERLEAMIDANPYAAPRDFGRALEDAENALRTVRARDLAERRPLRPVNSKTINS